MTTTTINKKGNFEPSPARRKPPTGGQLSHAKAVAAPSRQPNPKAISKPSQGIALMNKRRKSKKPGEKKGTTTMPKTKRAVSTTLHQAHLQEDSGWIGTASPEFGSVVN